ncbi:hypothetical protein PFL02_58580 [Pseudomonas fluorescens]|nr:hypothetical protein PFL02_58580 [Pseudomonas fluorescens]
MAQVEVQAAAFDKARGLGLLAWARVVLGQQGAAGAHGQEAKYELFHVASPQIKGVEPPPDRGHARPAG